jgi:outer membrane protein OmpA-like peptidoglycan-associated protein
MTGDSSEVRVLTQARAANVRDYLVQNFRMDDSRLKTMGAGKDERVSNDGDLVEIVIYPPGVQLRPTTRK